MESVDSLPQTYTTHTISQQTFFHATHNSFPAKLQREAYIKKIESLMLSNQALEQKKENLKGTVYDLKNLLTIVGKEGAEECEYFHSRNVELQKKVLRLQNALKYSHKSGKHLQRCASYWNQFVQQ